MFKRIDHVEIVPGDFERTLNFYIEILGFKIQMRLKLERPPLEEVVFIELGGTLIELFSVNEPAPVSIEPWQVSFRRITLEVEDMDKALEYLKAKGVEISSGPRVVESLRVRVAAIKDPDGLPIELVQRG
ncbi:MAG: VOC family protein [Dehalococcoidales bacterium]|nr:VOC family protein [Dehalococcoidales bacterium]